MKITTLLWGLLFPMIILSCASGNESKSLKQMENVDYIFQGRILKGGKLELPVALQGKKSKLVQVENVLLSSEGHENFKGSTIQVVLDIDEKLDPNISYVFYTKTWLFGKTLTVIADNVIEGVEISDVTKQIEDFQDKKIKDKFDLSELIIVGKVENIKRVKAEPRELISEHYPQWEIATLKVREVLKGKYSEKELQIFFSSSVDVHWYKSPKLTLAQQGIFILNKKEQFVKTKGNFLITETNEFYPISDLEKIKTILSKK